MEILMGHNPDELKSLLGFDETGLDLMRQQAAEEEQRISNILTKDENNENINNDDENDENDDEQKELDEIITNHKCPKCNYEW